MNGAKRSLEQIGDAGTAIGLTNSLGEGVRRDAERARETHAIPQKTMSCDQTAAARDRDRRRAAKQRPAAPITRNVTAEGSGAGATTSVAPASPMK